MNTTIFNMKYIALFLLAVIALQIPFAMIFGTNANFTLFDFIAPTFGAVAGLSMGIFTVILAQIVNILMHHSIQTVDFLRMVPIIFGVWAFKTNSKFTLVIPLLAIIGFNLHPIGRSAWEYSLLWIIPIVFSFFERNTFARAVISTFTMHAVGGVLWVWFFGLSKQVWLALIPVVITERTEIIMGMTLFYYLWNYLMSYRRQPAFV
jgi:hypothetical protein